MGPFSLAFLREPAILSMADGLFPFLLIPIQGWRQLESTIQVRNPAGGRYETRGTLPRTPFEAFMADSWYYARDDERNGPYSGRQLRDLADAGTILQTDTVWKTGVEQGVPATKVKHLFPSIEATHPVIAVVVPVSPPLPPAEFDDTDSHLVALSEPTPPVPVETAPEAPKPKPFQEPPARRRTASAGRGTIVMGQDGTHVRFKKQCTTCQHVDSSSISMKITQGTMKSVLFCPKCKKRRECELRGS